MARDTILKTDFSALRQEVLEGAREEMDEGHFHKGKANLIRFVGNRN